VGEHLDRDERSEAEADLEIKVSHGYKGKIKEDIPNSRSCARINRRLYFILAILTNFIEVLICVIIALTIARQGAITVAISILITIKRETHLVVLALNKFIIITLTKRRGSTLALAIGGLGDTTILDLVQRTLLLLGRAVVKNRLRIVVIIVRLGLLLLRSSTLARGLSRRGTVTTCSSC
jgi:hypothetical protein